MPHKTAEEAKSELVEKLGEEVGVDLYELEQEFVNLKILWRFYRSLYGTNPERIDLLNQTSGLYFFALEKLKFEAVVLGICRLTDPVETGRGEGAKPNLTVRRLGPQLSDEFAKHWDQLVTDLDAKIKFARDWRNKKIAHSSYDLLKGQASLEEASRETIEDALGSIAAILESVRKELLGDEMSFDAILPLDDEVRMLEKLYDGLELEKEDLEAQEKALENNDLEAYKAPPIKPEWLTKRP